MTAPTRRQFLSFVPLAVAARAAADVPPAVREAEAKRVEVVARVTPAVVAVCKPGGEASGSGVLIDPAGYALTNFHVTDDVGPVHTCGLPDGELYDSVLVGHDPVGDLALVKLLPKQPGTPFPAVPLGDSDAVKPGDWSLAMGNPFGIARDFTPSVTFGLISGTHRYQPPAGDGILEYTDCLQFDTSINPGNSGGPLFNLSGELIGINGRGQFDKRGRVNSGAGFAISVNQCKHFLPHLRAGLSCDHASLGASVETDAEAGDLAQMLVRQILEESDAYRRGLREGDRLLRFAGRPLTSVNHYKNVLGIFPAGWRLPLVYRRGTEQKEVLVRTQPTRPEDAGDKEDGPKPLPRPPKKEPRKKDVPKEKPSPAATLYEAKPGFANWHFNKQERDRLLTAFHKAVGEPAGFAGPWTLAGRVQLADRATPFTLTFADGADGQTEVKLARGTVTDAVKPLKPDQPLGELLAPTGSGGLLAALYLLRRLYALGEKGFEGLFAHGGQEPFYPTGTPTQAERCEVLRTKHAAFEARWFFRPADGQLVGGEATFSRDDDPCELSLADFKPVGGRSLPHRIEARYGDRRYAVLTVTDFKLGGGMTAVLLAAVVCASDPVTDVAEAVGPKLVKLFGAGGFRGVSNYGVGLLVSPDGYVLTASGPMLDTPSLVAHLSDGRRLNARLVASEPLLDVALVRLTVGDKPPAGLPFFDLKQAASGPPAQPGDWVLGFGNMFEIAVRDEPLTVQHGVVAAVTKLSGRRGTFGYTFPGPVYVIDAVTNNPGAAGGSLTDRTGRLLGLIGREVKNTQTETWVNYAIPITARVPTGEGGGEIGIPEFVAAGVAGKYNPVAKAPTATGPGGYHGIVLVPSLIDRTPPYVDAVRPDSPAAKAGLKPDDLIAFVNGEGVATVRAFQQAMAAQPPGTTVRLEVRRGGGLVKVGLTLADPPKKK